MNQKQQVVAARIVQLCKAYALSEEEVSSLALGVAIGAAASTTQLDAVAARLSEFVKLAGAVEALAQLKVANARLAELEAENQRLHEELSDASERIAELLAPPQLETEPPPALPNVDAVIESHDVTE